MSQMNRAILFYLLISPLHIFAQREARVTNYTTKLEGIINFSLIDDKYNAAVFSLEAPNPDGDADKLRLQKVKEASKKVFPYKMDRAQRKGTALAAPIVEFGFVADSMSGIPPDNDLAVSINDVAVSVMNSNIAILNANTGQMLSRKGLKPFSQVVGLNNIFSDNRYDPKIQYDADADRFICVMLNGRDQFNYIVVGFSLSNDPLGYWSFYKFYGNYKNDTTWFDYPGVVITKDDLFITGNKILFAAPWETGFRETVIYQINKRNGYDSSSVLNYRIWDSISYNGQTLRNLFPVRPGRGMIGPEQYFLSNRNFDIQNDTIFLVKVPSSLSGSGDLTIQTLKSPITYGVPPNGRQPDTSVVLATNDGRVLGAYAMNDEIQFVSTTVNPGNGSSAIFHGQISSYADSPSIKHAFIYSVDSLDFGYPNILYVGDSCSSNYSVISFNYSGPATPPGFGVILNANSDYSDMVKIKEGIGSISRLSGKNQRWGDYTGAQVDYNDTSIVWVEGIYGRSDRNYGNWAAKIRNPLKSIKCKGSEDTVIVNRLYPNPAFETVNYEFYMKADGLVQFHIYAMDGKLSEQILHQNVKKGRNVIQLNIGHLAGGIYYLKGVTQSGEEIIAQKILKL